MPIAPRQWPNHCWLVVASLQHGHADRGQCRYLNLSNVLRGLPQDFPSIHQRTTSPFPIMRPACPLLTLALCAVPSFAQFINPPPPAGGQSTNPAPSATPVPDFSHNPVWPLGSTQQIQWVADIDTYHLRLYQRFVSEQFPDINGYTYSTRTIPRKSSKPC